MLLYGSAVIAEAHGHKPAIDVIKYRTSRDPQPGISAIACTNKYNKITNCAGYSSVQENYLCHSFQSVL